MTSERASKKEVILIQTTVGDYRISVIEYLIKALGPRFRIFLGKEYFQDSLKTRIDFPENMEYVTNKFLLSRKVLIQLFDWRRALDAQVVIFELNPRIVSVWLLAGMRRLMGRPNLFWGHVWARSGAGSRTESVRHAMRSLADGLILYTYSERDSIAPRMKNTKLFVAPNSLYPAAMLGFDATGARDQFLYVGRVVKEKKVDVAIRAMAEAIKDPSFDARLVVVGDGPELEPNKALAATLGLGRERVEFLGHIGEPERLRPLYAKTIASLSPGYVGLSLTQSLSFGVPMIISRDEPHAPEIEAVREEENSLFFETDQPASLAEAMIRMARERQSWAQRGPDIVTFCRERYSSEAMGEGILNAIRYAEELAISRT